MGLDNISLGGGSSTSHKEELVSDSKSVSPIVISDSNITPHKKCVSPVIRSHYVIRKSMSPVVKSHCYKEERVYGVYLTGCVVPLLSFILPFLIILPLTGCAAPGNLPAHIPYYSPFIRACGARGPTHTLTFSFPFPLPFLIILPS